MEIIPLSEKQMTLHELKALKDGGPPKREFYLHTPFGLQLPHQLPACWPACKPQTSHECMGQLLKYLYLLARHPAPPHTHPSGSASLENMD